MRLLIVDDSSLIRLQLKRVLQEFITIQIEEATNGIEALEKHRSFKPHVIILDYIIPAPDGLAILKILTQIDKNVIVIMFTTLGNQKFIYKDCITCGAYAILGKPVDKERIVATIQSIQNRISVGDGF